MKKIVALLLAASMLSTASMAFAAGSVTTDNNATGSVTTPSEEVIIDTTIEEEVNTGASAEKEVTAPAVEDVAPSVELTASEAAEDELKAAAAAVAAGEAVVTIYDEDTQAKIAELVEDAASLELIEVAGIELSGAIDSDLEMTLSFATNFTSAKNVVVVIKAGDKTFVIPAKVNANGSLTIELKADEAAAIAAAKDATVSVLAN